MNHTQELIDVVITDWLGLPLTDPYIATEWRPFILRCAQRVVEEVRDASDWYWIHGTLLAQPLLANADTLVLPANFSHGGYGGKVWIQGVGPVKYRAPRKILALNAEGHTGNPEFYTIYGMDATTRRPTMLFDSRPASGILLDIRYEKKRPTLVDDDTAGTNGLDEIPEDFHLSPIYEGVCDIVALHGGDGRAISELSPRFFKSLARKIAKQQQGLDAEDQLAEEGISELGMY